MTMLPFGVVGIALMAQVATPLPKAPTAPMPSAIERIFAADQADRAGTAIDWSVVAAADARRRVETRALLDAGVLTTGEDYDRAAFVFQHGTRSEDFLLAHSLAMIAAVKGDAGAAFIAAATLDRYLMSIGQPQIYGTQFNGIRGGGVTQEPYDRSLVSDALRRELGAMSLSAQRAYVVDHTPKQR